MNQSISEIKCVIFDCDGVLVDSERLCCKALVNVFSPYRPNFELGECMKHFKGGKVADILSDTIARLQLKISVDDVEPAYREQVSELFDSELAPIAGITQALDDLSSVGVDFCVVSNSEKHKIAHSLELTGLLNRFEGKVFSAFEANSWKPDPDILLYAAVSMGYSPSECLYIDDTEKGLITGLKAGIKTVYFKPNDLSPACEIESDFEILELTDLIKVIKKSFITRQ